MVKNTKKTMQDTDNCVRRPALFVFISHYSLMAGVVLYLRLSSPFFLLNDLLDGLAVLADYVDALLESLCAVGNLNATDGEHLYVVVYVSLC